MIILDIYSILQLAHITLGLYYCWSILLLVYILRRVCIYYLLELNMLCDCVTRGCGDHSPLTIAAILEWRSEGEVIIVYWNSSQAPAALGRGSGGIRGSILQKKIPL